MLQNMMACHADLPAIFANFSELWGASDRTFSAALDANLA